LGHGGRNYFELAGNITLRRITCLYHLYADQVLHRVHEQLTEEIAMTTPLNARQELSFLARLKQSIFPVLPDFYGFMNQQSDIVVAGIDALVLFMQTGSEADAQKVQDMERQGDLLKYKHIDVLHHSFATPLDREDIYRAIASLDEILNYAKSTVREMQILGLAPDEHTLAMAKLMREGVAALQHGFICLEKNPLLADTDAEVARKTERSTEKVYRAALAELFHAGHYAETLTHDQERAADSLRVLLKTPSDASGGNVTSVTGFVLEILKRREVYRHMSNMADRIAQAGEVLHNIVAKIV
jgi:uncharacterized protein Yka (UPF0111/DUF47 family)